MRPAAATAIQLSGKMIFLFQIFFQSSSITTIPLNQYSIQHFQFNKSLASQKQFLSIPKQGYKFRKIENFAKKIENVA